MRPKIVLRCLALLVFLAASFSTIAPATTCPPPCKRPQCKAQCGSQQPAFCEIDEFGCSVCMCNG